VPDAVEREGFAQHALAHPAAASKTRNSVPPDSVPFSQMP
jgi:hypothetical protein